MAEACRKSPVRVSAIFGQKTAAKNLRLRSTFFKKTSQPLKSRSAAVKNSGKAAAKKSAFFAVF